jgi:hypothetical protein
MQEARSSVGFQRSLPIQLARASAVRWGGGRKINAAYALLDVSARVRVAKKTGCLTASTDTQEDI